jgi:hypothetical protein
MAGLPLAASVEDEQVFLSSAPVIAARRALFLFFERESNK